MTIAEICEIPASNDGGLLRFDLQSQSFVPFDIQRVYYIYGTTPGVERGGHAHIDLKQLAVCVIGSCRFRLDNGVDKEEALLDSPSKGLLIDSMVWREMYDFSPDCVLVVLASKVYDEADYIRDYDRFIDLARTAADGPALSF